MFLLLVHFISGELELDCYQLTGELIANIRWLIYLLRVECLQEMEYILPCPNAGVVPIFCCRLWRLEHLFYTFPFAKRALLVGPAPCNSAATLPAVKQTFPLLAPSGLGHNMLHLAECQPCCGTDLNSKARVSCHPNGSAGTRAMHQGTIPRMQCMISKQSCELALLGAMQQIPQVYYLGCQLPPWWRKALAIVPEGTEFFLWFEVTNPIYAIPPAVERVIIRTGNLAIQEEQQHVGFRNSSRLDECPCRKLKKNLM